MIIFDNLKWPLIVVLTIAISVFMWTLLNSESLAVGSDVQWSSQSITIVKDSGVMVGDMDGKFRAKDAATREEVAVVSDRILEQIKDNNMNKAINYNIALSCGIIGLLLGLILGFIAFRRKQDIIVNVDVPEMKPVVNVTGGVHGSSGDKSYMHQGANDSAVVRFTEESYKPQASTFKNIINDDTAEVSIKESEGRGGTSKEDMKSELDKLMEFQKKQGKS